MHRTNPRVDDYFREATKWREELGKLREMILDLNLTEELKWDKPFYTVQNGNVLVLWAFKDHCALGFCKGALLKDARGLLSEIGPNTQAALKIRFTSVKEIADMEPVLRAYIQEAVAVEKAGLEVKYKETSEFAMPAELKNKLEENTDFKAAFEALTPGRQRGYILHFSAPKQAKTREARIDKCMPQIFEGRGYNDRPGR